MGGGKQRNFRKRKALEDQELQEEEVVAPEAGDAGAESGALSLRDKLAGTKMLQKHRVRSKGLDASSLALGKGGEDQDTLEQRAKGMLGDAIDLSAAFNKEELVDEEAEDPNMQKYVEQELARIRGKKLDDADETDDDPARKRRLEEEELYRVPDSMRVQTNKDEGVADMGNTWASGIQEVALSVEHKLANIEKTEAAKRALLEQSAKKANVKDPFASDGLPTNFKDITANISRDGFVKQFGRAHLQQGAPPAGGRGGGRGPRSRDDQAMAKFKRDERERWRRR